MRSLKRTFLVFIERSKQIHHDLCFDNSEFAWSLAKKLAIVELTKEKNKAFPLHLYVAV
jgi:hypothetical protein